MHISSISASVWGACLGHPLEDVRVSRKQFAARSALQGVGASVDEARKRVQASRDGLQSKAPRVFYIYIHQDHSTGPYRTI